MIKHNLTYGEITTQGCLQLVELIKPVVKQNSIFIDIGSGYGLVNRFVAEMLNIRSIGIEIDKEKVDIARKILFSNRKNLITYINDDFLNLLAHKTLKSEDAVIFSNNVTWQKQVTKALFDNTKGHLFVMNPCGMPHTQTSTINTSWRKEKLSTIYKLNTNTNR